MSFYGKLVGLALLVGILTVILAPTNMLADDAATNIEDEMQPNVTVECWHTNQTLLCFVHGEQRADVTVNIHSANNRTTHNGTIDLEGLPVS